ncbi:single-stranded DNA-binding protein [Salinicoccus roseus]|uniref:Single-stranded DNA-binding protein n=1 Tax=Salinicoccus roseus TaxID=45670 RepID=A0A0C2E3A1_9STAP|nr:single-stranded DNA-binding protein [Salinicoccus roseus]KIH69922.1 single-stranded DNA-binding protein [Salinicoccus roseus]MDB0581211.1 single-stranded DNA-binding protein [Salinicoccus roseus]
MLNRVVLVGRLTKDPELKVSQSNISVVNFTLAVNRPFTDANGERGADFINIVAFRKQAENVNQYLKKGSLAGVDGRLQSRSYENKEGQRVYVTEVVADSVQFLEPKGSNGSGGQSSQKNERNASGSSYGGESRGQNKSDSYTNAYNRQSRQREPNPFQGDGPVDISDDDLPF